MSVKDFIKKSVLEGFSPYNVPQMAGALLAALGGFHIQLELPLVGNAQDAACLGTLGHFRQLDGVKLLVAVCADGVFAI